jgi:PEP-CTERM motif-containing protein
MLRAKHRFSVSTISILGIELAIAIFCATPSRAGLLTCSIGGNNAPSGWSLFGVGGGVAANAPPFVSPSGSASDCYIMTDTSNVATDGPWPGLVSSGFDIKTIPGIPSIPSDPANGIVGTTNGSAMISPIFTANASQNLNFDFAFITNDGTETFSDWAAAFLLPVDAFGVPTGPSLNLFTARTSSNSQVVPGYGFASFPSGLTLTPGTAFINGATFFLSGATGGTTGLEPDATQFGPIRYPFQLGDQNADPGGSTPWINAIFGFDASTAGTYELVMAVGNVGDEIYSTGLLFAGQSISGGSPAEDVPEPGTLALFATGLLGLGAMRFRRKSAAVQT